MSFLSTAHRLTAVAAGVVAVLATGAGVMPTSAAASATSAASVSPIPPGGGLSAVMAYAHASPTTSEGAVCYFGACYSYVDGAQYADATGASVLMKQARPEVARGFDGHSLQELAVESRDGQQIVEVGWTVDRSLNGDSAPHLFVYHWVDGKPSCYNTCGFVSTSGAVTPGMRLRAGEPAQFGIEFSDGAWRISYDGMPVGYFPGKKWGGRFRRLGLVQTFGEVAAKGKLSCTDMGDGRFAAARGSSWIGGLQLFGTDQRPALQPLVTTPNSYTGAHWTPAAFHLGGPGTGGCSPDS